MKSVFIALASTNMLLIVAATIVGAMVEGERFFALHFAIGLVTTLLTCFGHCVVLTYFMATSRMIALAVEDAHLDPQLVETAASHKSKAIRVLMPAIALGLLAAFSGGYVTRPGTLARIHLAIVLTSIAFQCLAWKVEYGLIDKNGHLVDRVFETHRQSKPPTASANPS